MATSVLPNFEAAVRDVTRPNYVRFWEHETISEAVSRLRRQKVSDEQIVYFYVTDEAGTLVGVVPTRRLLLSDAATPVSDIMTSDVVSVNESDPFLHALRTFIERRLLALPVVDNARRLKGVLDVRDITERMIDFEHRESAEEVFQLLGVHLDRERRRSPLWVIRNRFPWLLFNISGGFGAALISGAFNNLLRTTVALAFFVPLVLSLSESIAMQSVSMSLDQLHAGVARRPRPRRMFREMSIGGLLGLSSGLIVGLIAVVWLGLYKVAVVVAGGVMIAGATGATFGFFIPRLINRWNLNPRVAAGPVTLALADAASIFCYFTLCWLVLRVLH